MGTDYSYGMYVYGYPIQQTISYLLPAHRVWYINASLGVLFAWMVAYLSWHLVEAPVLRRKDFIVAAADSATARLQDALLHAWHSAPLSRLTEHLLPATNTVYAFFGLNTAVGEGSAVGSGKANSNSA